MQLLKIAPDPSDEDILTIETTARLTRSGRVLRMIQAGSSLIRPTVGFHQFCKVEQGSRQSIYLLDDDDVDPTGSNVL